MAVSWGSWDYGGGNGMRVGLDVINESTPITSSTTWTCDCEIWTGNQYNYDDPQQLNYSGEISGTKSYTNDESSGTSTKRDTKAGSYTYPSTSYGVSPGTLSFTASVSGAYNGTTPSHTLKATIPARPYAVPAAPTGVTGTRNSDAQATIKWTNAPTSQKPITSHTVQMRTYTGSTWGAWATIYTSTSGTTTQYIKTGLSSNRIYQFQVRTNNSIGSSAFVVTAYVYMTPSAPTGVTAALVDGTIKVDWASAAYVSSANTHKIERSVDGGAWVAQVSGIAQATKTWTDNSPAPGLNVYRVATTVSVGPLTSAWAQSPGGVTPVTFDVWVWDGTVAKDAKAYVWNGTSAVPASVEVFT